MGTCRRARVCYSCTHPQARQGTSADPGGLVQGGQGGEPGDRVLVLWDLEHVTPRLRTYLLICQLMDLNYALAAERIPIWLFHRSLWLPVA